MKRRYPTRNAAVSAKKSNDNIVKLNVGGTIFQTSKSTLTKFDGFFKTMLETRVLDESDATFIDRSPMHFDSILDYMRDGDVDLQKSPEDVRKIRNEAQFYELEELVEICSLEIENRKVQETFGKPGNIIKDTDSTGGFVKLNIGGTIFQTSKSTLTKFDGFFKTMLETRVPITKDKSGAIFIDRDPTHFQPILNYMRDGHLNLPTSSDDVKKIQNEAEFYLLDGLVEICRVSAKNDTEIIVKLNVGGTIFQTSKSTLTSFDGPLRNMIDHGAPIAKDESGLIFIDRDPAHFPSILNYWRNGAIEFAESDNDVLKLRDEAEFYHLWGLEKLCVAELQKRSKIYETHGRCNQAMAGNLIRNLSSQLMETVDSKPMMVVFVLRFNGTFFLQITVKFLSGKKITLRVKAHDTIEKLTIKIRDAEGFPPHQQIILFRCKQLWPECTLASAEVQSGDVLYMVPRLR